MEVIFSLLIYGKLVGSSLLSENTADVWPDGWLVIKIEGALERL